MFPLILSLCYASIFCGCVSGTAVRRYPDEDYGVQFPKHGITDYINIWGMPSLTQITVCFWMKSAESTGTVFSYKVPHSDNEILIYSGSGSFTFWIGGTEGPAVATSANDDNWHHICLSWQSSDGAWKFYKDGQKKNQGTITRGHTIRGGGSLMLGQDQDTDNVLDKEDSYQGYLANVNVWSYVLPQHEIDHQSGSGSCLIGEGDVYKWSDFRDGLRGDVRIVIPSPCSPED